MNNGYGRLNAGLEDHERKTIAPFQGLSHWAVTGGIASLCPRLLDLTPSA